MISIVWSVNDLEASRQRLLLPTEASQQRLLYTEWAIIPKALQTHVPKTCLVIFQWQTSISAVKHHPHQGGAIFAERIGLPLVGGWNRVWCFAPLRGIMCMIKSHPIRLRIATEFSNHFQFHWATAVI